MFNNLKFKLSNLFIIDNKFEHPYLLSLLVFLIYFSILSTVIGTFVLNLSLVLFCIIFAIFYIKNKKKIEITSNFKILYISIALLIFNIILSDHLYYSAKTSLGLIKNIIFLIGCYIVFKIDKRIFDIFVKLVFFIFIFTSLDTILQYLTGKDIFGYTKSHSYGRLSGPFDDELIVGSFLSKILFISILYFLLNFKNKYYDLIFITFAVLVIFLTKERSASIMAILASFIYIFLRIEKFKYKIISLSFFALFIIISFTAVPDSFKRYKFIYNSENNFLDTQWGAHFLTSYEIFKKNPILGSGIKTYRFECRKDYLKNINSKASELRCSTHPHNFYFEILSDTGILGIGFFLFFLLLVLKKIIFSYNQKMPDNNLSISICLFLLFFWPLKTTGSIFSSWNSYFYILSLIIIFYQINFIKLKLR